MHTEYEKEHSLEERVVALLKQRGFTVTTTESCTGGLLAGRLLNVAGASEVYREGYITYSNEAKEKLLEVSKDTLSAYGAVSEQTALEMAQGAARQAGAQAALATTGIAGPDGGTEEKHLFAGERAQVRALAVETALGLLERALQGVGEYTES